jgi:hypothetical protein
VEVLMKLVKGFGILFVTCCLVLPMELAAQTYAARSGRPNELTPAERAAGWKLLFDGKTLHGWRGLGYDSVPTAHWKVEDGAIKKIPSGAVAKMPDGQPAQGGDLMTEEAFGDYELSWEWKVKRRSATTSSRGSGKCRQERTAA